MTPETNDGFKGAFHLCLREDTPKAQRLAWIFITDLTMLVTLASIYLLMTGNDYDMWVYRTVGVAQIFVVIGYLSVGAYLGKSGNLKCSRELKEK